VLRLGINEWTMRSDTAVEAFGPTAAIFSTLRARLVVRARLETRVSRA
jgi:hypothetical protein